MLSAYRITPPTSPRRIRSSSTGSGEVPAIRTINSWPSIRGIVGWAFAGELGAAVTVRCFAAGRARCCGAVVDGRTCSCPGCEIVIVGAEACLPLEPPPHDRRQRDYADDAADHEDRDLEAGVGAGSCHGYLGCLPVLQTAVTVVVVVVVAEPLGGAVPPGATRLGTLAWGGTVSVGTRDFAAMIRFTRLASARACLTLARCWAAIAFDSREPPAATFPDTPAPPTTACAGDSFAVLGATTRGGPVFAEIGIS